MLTSLLALALGVGGLGPVTPLGQSLGSDFVVQARPGNVVSSGSVPDFFNPSFENPNLGASNWMEPPPASCGWTGTETWGIANGSGSWGTDAHSGEQYAFIQAEDNSENTQGTLQQTIVGLRIGQSYRVTFWMARRNGDVGANTGAPVSLYANGNLIFGPIGPTNDARWNHYESAAFTAAQGSCTFVFVPSMPDDDDTTTLIDDVHLMPGK